MNTLQEQREHYAAIRRRLWSGPYVEKLPRRTITERPVEPPKPKPQYIYLVPIGPGLTDVSTPRRPTAREIIREVARQHNVSIEELQSPSRVARLGVIRMEIYYRLRLERGMSFPQIGALMGGRDHTTVLHGVRVWCRRNNLPIPPIPTARWQGD